MVINFLPLSESEREQLLASIGPLPIRGQAWPAWVKTAAWVILAVIVLQSLVAFNKAGVEALFSTTGLILLVVFLALAVTTRYMQTSVTTIDAQGLRQSWLTRREVAWQDVTFAKFVPMLASKRLVVFTKKGKPVVFQGGTQELQVAFAKISLAFKNRKI
ncbi:membrane protein [Advenella mimigardefordensis]|uniref:Putative membrane protein n=1 Tax=Advenella mimigardefordensis (strain DSM 17166 / LMG 22922 / DPN7) TaxID=1247726 RepID=W0P7J0_ADVMD|nr:membrane protein [Advenella mimigardefordensis]AHG62814.1 putative membrane protein [Advenella mimigardefordensis DPN7]